MAELIQILRHVLETKDPQLPNETRRIVIKEALQSYLLDFIYNHPRYRQLNFYGGTCLHVIYGLNRLSEDIDLDNTPGVNTTPLADDLLVYIQKRLAYPEVTFKAQQSSSDILHITLKFPFLAALDLTRDPGEALHVRLDISQHVQLSELHHTPVIFYSHSFVPVHFSLETMMAAKILACLERSYVRGHSAVSVKGRDYYDLLWMMQQNVRPLEVKLAQEGKVPYSVQTAFQTLKEKVAQIPVSALAEDLSPLFEQRNFIEAWLKHFHENFNMLAESYIQTGRIALRTLS